MTNKYLDPLEIRLKYAELVYHIKYRKEWVGQSKQGKQYNIHFNG